YLLIYRNFAGVTQNLAKLFLADALVRNASNSITALAQLEDDLAVIEDNVGVLVHQATTLFASARVETTIIVGMTEILKAAQSIESLIINVALTLWKIHYSG